MESAMAEMPNGLPARPASYDKKVGLVLQGGGALGSYQAGVYEALASSEYLPDWVAGISIGAINAAIIAGNRPDERLKHLRAFWNEITAHTGSWPDELGWPFAAWQRQASALIDRTDGKDAVNTGQRLAKIELSPGRNRAAAAGRNIVSAIIKTYDEAPEHPAPRR
jgi:predicted acylesterase/phospholipase RssA